MLSIYICEDDKKQLNDLKKTIEAYVSMQDTDIFFYCATSSPFRLLNAIKEARSTGLYFLDIELESEINGLELAKQIRVLDPRAYIVFITSHSDMTTMTYEYQVEAMDFILKDDQERMIKRVCKCISTATDNQKNSLNRNNSSLNIRIDGTRIVIDQNDILLITSSESPHKILIYRDQDVLCVSGSLKEYKPKLNQNFFRCNQSTIINLLYVDKYYFHKGIILMKNGENCSVPLRSRRKFQQALTTFQSKQ